MDIANEIEIGARKVSLTEPVYFIADIAANHDGDLGRAKDLIHLAAESGADAAKFQHFQAKTIVSDAGFKALGSQLSHQSQWEKSVYETYEDASLDLGWTPILRETCMRAGIHFFTSPYAFDLVDAVHPFVPAFKIGSGDINFLQVIEYMAQKGKPVLLATGAANMDEVERAVKVVVKHNKQLALMQCNTNYTGSPQNFKYINLNVLQTFSQKYPGMILGLSDHTPGHAAVLGAIALGARIIEKHFTDDNERSGPDHPFSMTPATWHEMVERSRELQAALGDGIKRIEPNEADTVVLQRRCLRLSRDLPAGAILTEADLEALRPAPNGTLEPFRLPEVVGSKLRVQKNAGDALYLHELAGGAAC